jgi:hypothetical protein
MSSVIADDYKEDLSVRNDIMILFCVFFPYLFPFFMLYRIIKHRHYPHKKISDLKLMAVFLLFVFSLFFAVAVSMERDPVLIIFVSAITFLPSMIMFGVASNKSKKINERYNHYRELITQNSIRFIEDMAQATGQRPLVVRNELKHMIHNNLLSGIEIHGNQIIKTENKWTPMINPSQTKKPEDKGKPSLALKPKIIECHGCGASSTLMEGETTKCEYCDSIVS